MPELRLALLGRFELSGPEGAIDLTSKKLVGLVALLGCTMPKPQSREKLIGLLWGSRFDAQAHQSFRQALTRLRRALGPSVLISNADSVSLDAAMVDCDVIRFESLIRLGSPETLREAVDLYRGPLLADLAITEEPWTAWLDVERQRLENLALDAMVRLGECELQSGNIEVALRTGQRAISMNNLREDAHRLIMRALAAAGRRVEGLRYYDEVTALLQRELNVPPDSATRQLVDDIRRESGAQHLSASSRAGGVAAPTEREEPRVAREVTGIKSKNAARPVGADGAAPGSSTGLPQPAAGRAKFSHPPRRRLVVAAAALLLLLVGAAVVNWQYRGGRIPTVSPERMALPLPQKPSIAVLPFESLSGDAAHDLISAGLTESLVNVLARNPLLFVIAHSSASAYAGGPDAARRAAEELGVRYIVEGRVKRAGDRVRVTVQLVDAVGGRILWSERYERTAEDLLALEEEITAEIARSLDVRILYGTDQSSGGTRRLDAWTAYLQGRNEYLKFSEGGNARAQEHYRRALEIDPNYAEAMVALAGTYLIGMIEAPKEDWEGVLAKIAELERRAADIAPRMPRLYQLRSLVALTRGQYAQALSEAQAMVGLDPNNAESHLALGRIHLYTGQYERSIEHFTAAQRIDPHSRGGYSSHLAMAQLALGRTDLAVSTLETVVERWPDYQAAGALLAIGYQLAGRHADARKQVGRLPRGDAQTGMLGIERVFSAMKDEAFAARVIAAARQAGLGD